MPKSRPKYRLKATPEVFSQIPPFLENKSTRSMPVDALRGLVIGMMIFLNWVSGVHNMPAWLFHSSARANTITIADLIFGSFLFIMGMAMPLAFKQRLGQPGGIWKLPLHVLWRVASLLLLGMVSASMEHGFAPDMVLRKAVWKALFFFFVFVFWMRGLPWIGKLLGGLGLAVVLALFRHNGPGGTELWLRPYWWGILGMLGWAYFFSFLGWAAVLGKRLGLYLCLAAMIGLYYASRLGWIGAHDFWFAGLAGSHPAITMAGMILGASLNEKRSRPALDALIWGLLLLGLGFSLRRVSIFSKLSGTPSWAMVCAGVTALAFALIYLLHRKEKPHWPEQFLALAGQNPLLAYLLPDFCAAVINTMRPWGLDLWPFFWPYGQNLEGAGNAAAWAVLMLGIAALVTKKGYLVRL